MRHIVPDKEGLARIPIDQLVLDSGNPRIPGMEETEAETIGLMLRDQRKAGTNKLVALATSIAEHGYSANDPLLVKPLGEDRFLVVEGNRRVTAMKLAVAPSLLPAEFSDLGKRFEALGEKMAGIEPFCLVSENDEYLKRMMWLRHSGTGGGEGLDPWNSAQKARYKEAHDNKPDPYLRLRDTLIEHFPAKSQARADAASISHTTFKRFFQAPEVKHELGIRREDSGLYSYDGGHDDRLRYVLRELADKGERRIDSKAQVLDLLEESKGSPIVEDEPSEQPELELGDMESDAPDHGNITQEDMAVNDPTGPPDENTPNEGESSPRRLPLRRRPEPRAFDGETLRPSGKRSNELYRAIEWLDGQYRSDPKNREFLLPVLGFSLRALLEVVAREFYLERDGKEPGESAVGPFMKEVVKPLVKEKMSEDASGYLALRAEWITGRNTFEGLLHKWAHGAMVVNYEDFVEQSVIVAEIIKAAHWKD